MKKLLGLLSGILFGLFLIGCQVEYKNFNTDKINLRQLVNKDVTETHTSGVFFLVAGSMSSSTDSRTVVKVMGEVNGEYRFMEFNFETVRIKIDNSVKTPYIVLNYRDESELTIDYLLEYKYNIDSVTIVCPEQYLPEKLLPIQL